MLKREINLKFVTSLEKAEEILGKVFTSGLDIYSDNYSRLFSVNERTKGDSKYYDAYVQIGSKETTVTMKNDYEILTGYGQHPNLDVYHTECLRAVMTKEYDGYVDGLEEFLDDKTKNEVAKYRELLVGEEK